MFFIQKDYFISFNVGLLSSKIKKNVKKNHYKSTPSYSCTKLLLHCTRYDTQVVHKLRPFTTIKCSFHYIFCSKNDNEMTTVIVLVIILDIHIH